MAKVNSTRVPPALQPIVGPDGVDQFGIGPVLREAQLRWGTYPTPPKKAARRWGPLSYYGADPSTSDPVVVHVDVAGVATAEQVRRLEADVRDIAEAVAALERRRGG